jgi:hypothetical protein
MFTLIIKGLNVDESEKYNKVYESVDAGKKAGNFMGLLGDDLAGVKNIFIGFQYLYLFPERSRKNDMTLESICSVIKVEDTILILSAIRPVIEFLRSKDDAFEFPASPCWDKFAAYKTDPALIQELADINKCSSKEKIDNTNRYLTFALTLIDQSIEGLSNTNNSLYFLPIFIISLIHRVTVDLTEFDFESINIQMKYPYMTDAEIAVNVRKLLPKFALAPADVTKKGGFHTLKRRDKRSRRVRRKKNRPLRSSSRRFPRF